MLALKTRPAARYFPMIAVLGGPVLILVLSTAALAGGAPPQTEADEQEIKAAVLDYIEGFYTGDTARMKASIHPNLAKRIVDRWGELDVLRLSTREQLVAGAVLFSQRRKKTDNLIQDFKILDRTAKTASVKTVTVDFIDYIHLAKMNGRWIVVNVLWESIPPAPAAEAEDQKKQSRAEPKDLPSAEGVLDNYIAALGGTKAFGKIRSRICQGTVEIEGANLQINMTQYETTPDKMCQILTVGGYGTIERGINGEKAWRIHPSQGVKILEGQAQEFYTRRCRIDSDVHWRELYVKVECVDLEDVEGKLCYKLVMTPLNDNPEFWYISCDDSLIVRKELVFTESELGEKTITESYHDFREIDGVLLSHHITSIEDDQIVQVIISDIDHNTDIPENRFDPPETP